MYYTMCHVYTCTYLIIILLVNINLPIATRFQLISMVKLSARAYKIVLRN